MIRLITAIPFGITLLTACGTMPASSGVPVYVDTAEVIKAEPLYQAVQVARPVNECWTETVAHASPRSNAYTGPLAGGIIGGVIGSRLGRGRGNTPLAVAGALLGASIGRSLSEPAYGPPTYSDVQRCRTVNHYEQRQQVVGYRVDYRYEGQTFSTQTRRHPGRYIRVRVNVDPVDGT
jgi:uncharacterized protein YcfJ